MQASRSQNDSAGAADTPSTATLQSASDSTTPTDTSYRALAADANVSEATTPTDASDRTMVAYRTLQELALALDAQGVGSALFARIQEDTNGIRDEATLMQFATSASVTETALAQDVLNGVVTKLSAIIEGASASDLQAAATTLYGVLRDQLQVTDVASALASMQCYVVATLAAKDVVKVVIPVGQTDGTNATDTQAVFLFPTNRMLLLFDQDCCC